MGRGKQAGALSFGPLNTTYSSFTLSLTRSTFQSLIILEALLAPVRASSHCSQTWPAPQRPAIS